MKKSLLFILFVAILVLWQIYVVTPYMDAHNFFNESTVPDVEAIPLFILMAYVPFIFFFLSLILAKGVSCLRCIVYPLAVMVLYFGTFVCLTAFGGAIIWLMIFTLPIFFMVEVVVFVVSLIIDLIRCEYSFFKE